MATERTAMTPFGEVIRFTENKDAMTPQGQVVSEQLITTTPSGFKPYWALIGRRNNIIGAGI